MEKLLTSDILVQRQILRGTTRHDSKGKCVLYVMGRDQRVHDNHALLAAQTHAIEHNLPLAVVFVFNTTKAKRAREQYIFMIDALYEVEAELANHNIPFIGLVGEHEDRLRALFHHLTPAAIYFDFNPLKGPQKLVEKLATTYPIIVVDTHNIVPVWVASDKQEIGARTLRPKFHRQFATFFVEPSRLIKHTVMWPNKTIIPLKEVADIFNDRLQYIPQNAVKPNFIPGAKAAHQVLEEFVATRFSGYAQRRNDPSVDGLSNLSPYLHYGHISSLRVILNCHKALQTDSSLQDDYNALLEEMGVRKELSDNYCYYNSQYDVIAGAPLWAQQTLQKHSTDPREFLYSKEQFENAQTHDEAWNAAQRQLRSTGKIHGYMRMYWAKKVLEWSATPQDALRILIYLNDFYSLDGGDPNGYVGILWSIAGLHDRPWGERAVYGTIRSMVYGGLKRKFDIEKYIAYYSS